MKFDSGKRAAFWFHYNKPESRKQGRNVLTVHCQKQCLIVHTIECKVPTATRDRNQQPRCVLAGTGRVKIKGKTAIITAS